MKDLSIEAASLKELNQKKLGELLAHQLSLEVGQSMECAGGLLTRKKWGYSFWISTGGSDWPVSRALSILDDVVVETREIIYEYGGARARLERSVSLYASGHLEYGRPFLNFDMGDGETVFTLDDQYKLVNPLDLSLPVSDNRVREIWDEHMPSFILMCGDPDYSLRLLLPQDK